MTIRDSFFMAAGGTLVWLIYVLGKVYSVWYIRRMEARRKRFWLEYQKEGLDSFHTRSIPKDGWFKAGIMTDEEREEKIQELAKKHDIKP